MKQPTAQLKKATLLFCVLPFAWSLLIVSCRDNTGPLAADASVGYCPVCNMKVKSGDQWASEIVYSDNTKLMFETPGDLMTFYSAPEMYKVTEAQKNKANIAKIILKDFKTKQLIDARQAKLVYKSEVKGPMGRDFIAFGNEKDADDFAAANGGTVLGLDQVTAEMVKNLRKN